MQKLKIILFFITILYSTVSNAQTDFDYLDSELEKNGIQNLLPPLQTLLDSAQQHSPLLKVYDSEIIIQQLKIQSEKREWMESLGFQAGARYGLFDNLILKEALGIEDLAASTTEQTRYDVGVFLKIPLSSLADKSNVQMAKEEKNRLNFQKLNTLRELRQLVIIQYNNVIKAHKKMLINSHQVETYKVQMLSAEKDYENGIIDIAEYARLNNLYTTALISKEDTKIEFITALQLLRETTGTKIHLKKTEN